MSFKCGDFVTWSSQAGGVRRTKLGEVTDIIPSGIAPPIKGAGLYRDHESYVVRASVIDGKSHQLHRHKKYWPKVASLRPASKELRDNVERRKDHSLRLAAEGLLRDKAEKAMHRG